MFMRIFTVGVLLFIGFIIASVGLDTPFGYSIRVAIGHVPLGDKSLHFMMMAVLSFLLNASFQGRQTQLGGYTFMVGSLLAAAIITLEEFSQVFIPSRNFEIFDMVCNYAGVYTGSFIITYFPNLTTHFNHDHHRKTISIQTILNSARPLRHESRN